MDSVQNPLTPSPQVAYYLLNGNLLHTSLKTSNDHKRTIMDKKIFGVVREEVLSPRKFLSRLVEQRSNIYRVHVRPAKFGEHHFGKMVVRYKHPILKNG